MGNEAKLHTFMLASDYDPAHYGWTESELAALGDCKSTAEVIKKRLENNGAKVKEMYAIEHKSEKKADSKSKEFHGATDEAKMHYHLLVRFEPSHGATLKELSEYIGISPEIIEKPKPGRYSYDNMLSYLTHIKYVDKIQYAPEDVVTLAGSDYMDYYNERKKRWIKAREIVAKKGGKTRDRLFRETMEKLDRGELTYNEIALTKGGCALLTDSKYQKKLFTKSGLVTDLAGIHHQNMKKMIENGEINSWEQIEKSEQFKLLQCYGYIEELKNTLEAAIKKGVQKEFLNLKQAIKEYKINLPFEDIEACDEYEVICKYFKEEIENVIRAQAECEYRDLYYAVINREITRVEAKASEKYIYAYLIFKEDIEKEPMPYHHLQCY